MLSATKLTFIFHENREFHITQQDNNFRARMHGVRILSQVDSWSILECAVRIFEIPRDASRDFHSQLCRILIINH